MRTTLTLDDDLALTLKKMSQETERSFKAMVNDTLRAGLSVLFDSPKPRPYRIQTRPLGVKPGIDLTKAVDLAASLEDEEIVRKLEMRK